MDKIVHELKGFNTDVFYQIHNLGKKKDASGVDWANYNYLYHCSHCKAKGNISVKIEMGVIPEFSVYAPVHAPVFRTADIIEHKKNCPLCNANWKQSQRDVEPRSVQKITFDNGDIMYLYQDVYPRHKDAQPIVRQYKLRIKSKTGKMSLTVNDKSTHDVFTVSSMLATYRKYFDDVPTETEYYTSRNHRLKDILQYVGQGRPDIFFMNIHGNLRRRLYYAYDKHGMKAAYRTVLGNKGNKYLYKLAWQKPELISTLNKLIGRVGADSLANILKSVNENKIDLELLEKLKHLFDLGLSTAKVFNIANTGELELASHWLVQDSARMYSTLLSRTNSEYKLPKYRDLADLHELLIRDINQVEDATAKDIMLPLTNLEEYHASEYSIKVANTAHDLNLLGRVLNICVAGYRQAVLKGACVIAYVTKGNYMVACLQVSPETSSLVQAKLACNQPVSSNPDIERVVYSWVKDNRLNTKTADVGFETSFEKLNKIELAHRYEASKTLPNAMRPPVFDIPELPEDFPF